jgi:serine/threonine protein kinase
MEGPANLGFQFTDRLGEGTFATVWKARRISDGRPVAIKQLKERHSVEQCQRMPEIRVAQLLGRHACLVSLISVFRIDQQVCSYYCHCSFVELASEVFARLLSLRV